MLLQPHAETWPRARENSISRCHTMKQRGLCIIAVEDGSSVKVQGTKPI